MDISNFDEFLKNLYRWTNEELMLVIATDDISCAKRLKALKEKHLYARKFHFDMTIKATIEEYKKELNVFASGIKFIEKKE